MVIRRASKIFCRVTVAAAAVCLTPLAAGALTASGMGIAPAPNPAFPDRNKGWFIYEQVEPGTVIEDIARVVNAGNKKVTLAVEAVDAGMNEDGGFGLVGSPEDNEDIGKWIELSRTEVTLGANKEELVPFKINIPADAEVGDHIGALAVYQTTSQSDKVANIRGSQVSISTRVGARIYLTVKGDIVRGVKLLKRSIYGRGQTLMFGFKLKNLGNVRADLRMTAKIYSIWGLYDKKEGMEIGQVFPKKTINIQAAWPGKSRPIFGLYWASVTIEDVFKGLNPLSNPLPPSEPIHTWMVTFFVPWTQAAILVLVLFLVWFLVQLRRWRQMVTLAKTPVAVYRIKTGDHLMDIASRYGVGWKLLAKLNEIKPPYNLHGITQIYVPDVRGSRRDIRIPHFLAYIANPLRHFLAKLAYSFFGRKKLYYTIVVERGDTKKDIEKFTKVSWTELARYNGIGVAARPKVGQELKVPNRRKKS